MSNRLIKLPKPKKQRKRAAEKKKQISLFGLLSGTAALIGVIGVLATFLPRVTVTTSDPVDDNNPFSSNVTVTNTGYIPLDSVMPNIGLRKMTFGDPKAPTTFQGPANNQYVRFANTRWQSSDLGLDEKLTIGLNEVWGIQPNLLSADVAIVVEYKIPIIRWKRRKTFPLYAMKQTNGKWYWYSGSQ
jgi:hypothetical protein